METLKSIFILSVLAGVLYATGQVIAAEGWKNGAILLCAVFVLLSLMSGINNTIASVFKRRAGG